MATMKEGQRQKLMSEAFETFASGEERLKVQTKEGILMNINTNIFLFSPFLRKVFGLQKPSEALMFLPSVPLQALLAISDLLTTGLTNVDVPLDELASVASELCISGFSIESLQDTSDTSSVSTVGIQQETHIIQEALSSENVPS